MLMWNDEFLCEKPHEIDTVGSEDRLAGKIRSDKTLREELKDQNKKTQKSVLTWNIFPVDLKRFP